MERGGVVVGWGSGEGWGGGGMGGSGMGRDGIVERDGVVV